MSSGDRTRAEDSRQSPRIASITRSAVREVARLSGDERRLVQEAMLHPLPPRRVEPWRTRPGLYRARVGELRLMLRLEIDDTFTLLLVGRHRVADSFAQDYRPPRRVQAIPIEESSMKKNPSSNGKPASHAAPDVVPQPAASGSTGPEPRVPFEQLEALRDALAPIIRTVMEQSDAMILEHHEALRNVGGIGEKLAALADTMSRLEAAQGKAIVTAVDAAVAPVLVRLATFARDVEAVAARVGGLEESHHADRARIRSELDVRLAELREQLAACAGLLDGGQDQLQKRHQQLAQHTEQLETDLERATREASTAFEHCRGRLETVEGRVASLLAAGAADRTAVAELRTLVDDGCARLARLAEDMGGMKDELHAEIGLLGVLVDAVRAESDRQAGSSWTCLLYRFRSYVRACPSAASWSRSGRGVPSTTANR